MIPGLSITIDFMLSLLHWLLFVRFKRKREVEDLEFLRSKASRLSSNTEQSSVLDKLRQEIREYRQILKCSICLDRRKEVWSLKLCMFLLRVRWIGVIGMWALLLLGLLIMWFFLIIRLKRVTKSGLLCHFAW